MGEEARGSQAWAQVYSGVSLGTLLGSRVFLRPALQTVLLSHDSVCGGYRTVTWRGGCSQAFRERTVL